MFSKINKGGSQSTSDTFVHNLGYAFDLMSRLIPIDKERDDIKNQSCKAVNFFMDGCRKRTS
jgi:hypothetical protein